MTRWTEEDLATFQQNSGRGIPKETTAEIKRLKSKAAALLAAGGSARAAGRNQKFGAEPTVVDGIRFHSKLEARRYSELKLLQASHEVLYFLRQVPFDLPGGIRYLVDFMVVYSPLKPRSHLGGFVILEYEDCKGYLEPGSKLKIKQTEALYGIKVTLVKHARK